jgi:hypothetical protein
MLSKLFWSSVATAVCGIPAWLYLIARWLLEPPGFMAEFLVLGLGIIVLGSIQFGLFIFWIILLLFIWTGNNNARGRRPF